MLTARKNRRGYIPGIVGAFVLANRLTLVSTESPGEAIEADGPGVLGPLQDLE